MPEPHANVAELLQSVGGDALVPAAATGDTGTAGGDRNFAEFTSNLPKRDRFILAGFIWANVETVMQQAVANRVERFVFERRPRERL